MKDYFSNLGGYGGQPINHTGKVDQPKQNTTEKADNAATVEKPNIELVPNKNFDVSSLETTAAYNKATLGVDIAGVNGVVEPTLAKLCPEFNAQYAYLSPAKRNEEATEIVMASTTASMDFLGTNGAMESALANPASGLAMINREFNIEHDGPTLNNPESYFAGIYDQA